MITERHVTLVTSDTGETRWLGRVLGQALTGTMFIGVRGFLGVGKTVFVKGIADGLGMSDDVTSPTYTFVAQHHAGCRCLTHVDLYRISQVEDLESIGWLDLMLEADVIAVEWVDRAEQQVPDMRIDVELVASSSDRRHISFWGHGAVACAIIDQVVARQVDVS